MKFVQASNAPCMATEKEQQIFQITMINPKKKPFSRDPDADSNSSNSGSATNSDDSSSIVSRDQWNSKYEFLFSCISYSIGLGNLWRFPYKCYDNGGGAFLVPYIFFLFVAGMPLYFLELSLGQFSSQGPFGVWNISRLFIGLGYAMVAMSFYCSIYYNVIVAWILKYLFASLKALILQEPLPWSICQETTGSGNPNETNHECDSPSEHYWKRQVLQETDSIADIGGFQYEILAFFCVAWILVCLILIKGVKSSGKITYFTAIFPYVIIAALLYRGLTLDGASDGLAYYLEPKWEKLLEPSVWNAAASQIFYSLGLAFGSLITLASYSPFKNNIMRMTLVVTTINCSTSIIGGVVIFAVIGSLSKHLGIPVDQVVKSGPGLAFVVFPDAVSKMAIPALWAALFFFMLLNLGFGSQLAMVETVITAVVDRVPRLLKYKWLVCIGVCVLMFVLGLPMVTRSGVWWLNLMDNYSCSYSLFVISFIEIAAIIYVYGGKKILIQIEAMIGSRPCLWWLFTWGVTAPLSIFLIFMLNVIFYAPMTYAGKGVPVWAEGIGWLMALSSVSFIPICAIWEFYQLEGSFLERIDILTHPDSTYRPQHQEDLKKVNEMLRENNYKPLGAAQIYNPASPEGVQIGEETQETLNSSQFTSTIPDSHA